MFGTTEKVIAAVVVLVSVFAGFKFYGAYQYRQGVTDTKQAQYITQLEQFKQQTIELDKASKQLLHITQQLNDQSKKWENSYEEVVKKEPLHPDCVISAGRVQLINSAIEQASATRKSIDTMPADRKTK